jgi:cysteine desulfurase
MIYLDYSATTPVDKEVLESFNKVCNEYIGNPNSMHRLGLDSRELMYKATLQMANLLGVKQDELIFTSGATESNNLAIKGIALKYQNRGKHIITTKLEHASVSEVVEYLSKVGFEISYVNTLDNGLIDLEHLKSIIREDTILVSIAYVNSELGIIQPIKEIGEVLINYPKIYFHVDGTQAIGKINISLENIDLFSFSAHKIYGLKGIGCLYKRKKIDIETLIHGGKSQSDYRGGTPALPLIVSFSKALRLSLEDIDKKIAHVQKLNNIIKETLIEYPNVKINSTDKCLPHVLNISIIGIKPETFMHALETHNIFVSTQTACSKINEPSKSIMAIYKDEKRALSSIRVSLSHKTTIDEINRFLKAFAMEYNNLKFMNGE